MNIHEMEMDVGILWADVFVRYCGERLQHSTEVVNETLHDDTCPKEKSSKKQTFIPPTTK